jgi:diaminohydroxyphosphoribosylaminopyrimidine deaminase/5-amino-6-(5-phosphoribosylamino)uracil reductase
VRDDDPQLTVRDIETSRQPLRIVVDSRLETPPDARVLDGGNALVFTANADRERVAALEGRGAEVVVLPDESGKVDLGAMFSELGRRELNEVHVEAGFKLNGSLLQAGVVDELVLYLAPSLLGDAARGLFNLPALDDLSKRRALTIRDMRQVGSDFRIIARFAS